MILKDNFDLGLHLKPDLRKIIRNSADVWGTVNYDEVAPQLDFAITVYASLLSRDMGCDPITNSTFVRAMENLGLPKFISEMSKVYSESLQRQVLGYPSGIHPDIAQFVDWLKKANLKPDHWRVACSFLKRFTVNSETLKETCLNQFVDVDKRNKRLDRLNASNFRVYLDTEARKYITWLLGDFSDFVRYFDDRIESYDIPITSHAVSKGCNKPYHRYLLGLVGCLEFQDHTRWDWGQAANDLVASYCQKGLDEIGHSILVKMKPMSEVAVTMKPSWAKLTPFLQEVRISAVPKDASKYRIVSPEVPGRLAVQKIFNDYIKLRIFERKLEDNLPLWDQEKMRALCFESVNGSKEFSTIDESSASDTVRKSHILSLFRGDWARFLIEFSPKQYQIKIGETTSVRTLYMFAPMGSANTLLVESLVFWAYDCAITDFATKFVPGARKLLGNYKVVGGQRLYPYCCYVMGDDQQVLTCIAETLLEIQQMLGFMPNADKSFYDKDHLFRESCGVEYMSLEGEVININNPYFPRRTMKFQKIENGDLIPVSEDFRWDHTGESTGEWNSSLTSTISLAKRLDEAGYPVTSELIQRWLYLSSKGTLTSSPKGSQTSDLWLGELTRKTVAIPMGTIIDTPLTKHGVNILDVFKTVDEKTSQSREEISTPRVSFLEGHPTRMIAKWRLTRVDSSWDRGVHWSVSSKKKRLVVASLDERRTDGTPMPRPRNCPICSLESKDNTFVYFEKLFMESAFYYAALRKPYTPDMWIDPRDQYLVITEPNVGTTF